MVNSFSDLKSKSVTEKKFKHLAVPHSTVKSRDTKNGRFYDIQKGDKIVSYPSITTILSANPEKKEGLDKWRKRIGRKNAAIETQRCAERGEKVHELAEFYLKNVKQDFRNVPRLAQRMFNNMKPYLNRIDNIRAQEIALWSHTLKLAGRVDCIAEYNGVLSVIDFKTSNKDKRKEWITDYFSQGAAYSYMFEEMFGIRIDQIVILISVENSIAPQEFIVKRKDYRHSLLNSIKMYNSLANLMAI